MPSKRGGGSASPACKSQLRACMTGRVRSGGSLKSIATGCMSSFNRCRGGRKRKAVRKSRKSRRR